MDKLNLITRKDNKEIFNEIINRDEIDQEFWYYDEPYWSLIRDIYEVNDLDDCYNWFWITEQYYFWNWYNWDTLTRVEKVLVKQEVWKEVK